MAKSGFIRATVPAPGKAEAEITLPDPGELNKPIQSKPPTWVWMVIFVVAVVGLMIMLFRTGARQLSPGTLIILPVMLFSMVAMMRGGFGGAGNKDSRPAKVNHDRAVYLRRLDELRDDVHDQARAQAVQVAWHHPDPVDGGLVRLVGTGRMWERVPESKNFGHIRIGRGLTRLSATLVPPLKVAPPEHLEPVTAMAARDFLLTQNIVHDIPRPVKVFDQPGWAFFGEDRVRLQGLLRAMVCQLCVFHGPDHVRVAVVSDNRPSWEWAKWLPHAVDDELVDASGPVRLIFDEVAELTERLGADLKNRREWAPGSVGSADPGRRLVIVVDYPDADVTPLVGVTGAGRDGVAVLEATGNPESPLATDPHRVWVTDGVGNLLKPVQADSSW
jgi:DNA segregation ATPase FtsK/SpoIIIE-like protein